MVWLLCFILLVFIMFILSRAVKFLVTPKRKLHSACKQKRFLFIDNEDVRKNFQLTYKGAVFAGEKYIGAADQTFDVISISVWPENTVSLKGMVKEDFYFIDKKIHEQYPNAEINWKSPVYEFLNEH